MSQSSLARRIIICACLAALASTCLAADKVYKRELANGVTLTQIIRTCPPNDESCKPEVINILEADPKVNGVKVRTVLGQDQVMNDDVLKGREVVSTMVKRKDAIAGVNGDYHNWCGDPDNVFIMDGELISDTWSRRPVFAVRSNGTFIIDKLVMDSKVTTGDGSTAAINGLNRQRDGDELILYTPTYFKNTMTKGKINEAIIKVESGLPARIGVPIIGKVLTARDQGSIEIAPGTVVLSAVAIAGKFVGDKLTSGTSVKIELGFKSKETGSWANVTYSVGACPWIVKGGKFYMDAEEEHIVPAFYDVNNPRTAVGSTADGKIVIVTVDGRQATSAGMKLSELAAVMLSRGCVQAVNLDGGGSTEMATSFGVINSPSDGQERATATCLAVCGKPKPLSKPAPDFRIAGVPSEITSGGTAQLGLVDARTGKALKADFASKAIWATDGKIGMVDLSGMFHALKAHKGTIIARIGDKTATAQVSVTPGETSRLYTKFDKPDEKTPNVQRLSVWVYDKNLNPLKFQKLTVKVTGGTAEQTDLETNDDGVASVVITWDAAAQGTGQVEVRCGELSKTVVRPAK